MIYLGIDPGSSGGAATIDDSGAVVETYSFKDRSHLDLWNWFDSIDAHEGIIEKVHAMPGQGVTSMFTFGANYGELLMAITATGIPYQEVIPRKWQAEFSLARKKDEATNKYKNRIRVKAQQIFPKCEIWNKTLTLQRSVCDALLIAEYARRLRRSE